MKPIVAATSNHPRKGRIPRKDQARSGDTPSLAKLLRMPGNSRALLLCSFFKGLPDMPDAWSECLASEHVDDQNLDSQYTSLEFISFSKLFEKTDVVDYRAMWAVLPRPLHSGKPACLGI